MFPRTHDLDRTARRALAGVALALTLGAPSALADAALWQANAFLAKPQLEQTLNGLIAAQTPVREMASTVDGGWIVVTDEESPEVFWGGDVPSACLTQVYQYIGMGRQIDAIAFTPTNGWIVVAEDLGWHMGLTNMVQELEAALIPLMQGGGGVSEIVLDADGDGFLVLGNGGTKWHAQAVDADLYAAVTELKPSRRWVQRVEMDRDGNWVVLADDWFASEGIPQSMFDSLESWQRKERSLDSVMMGPTGDWVLMSHGSYTPNWSVGMEAIEYGLQGVQPDGSHTTNIWKRMQELGVAGVSLAVIEDGELRWSRGYGQLEHGTQRFVRTDSPFDTASVSKTMATMIALSVVDDPQEQAWLDMNIKNAIAQNPSIWTNDLYLWAAYGQVYKNDALPWQGLTLRRLLSHSAAMVPHGSEWFLPGDELPGADNLSDTLEILFGKQSNGNQVVYGGSKMPWYQEDLFSDGGSWNPGEVYKYSGGGYMVAQSMLEQITGQDFRTLADQRLFQPLGMADSTYDAPLPNAFEARAAVPHDENGDPLPVDERRIYPWAAAGGLWSTPTDLSQAVLTIMNIGTHPELGETIFGAQSGFTMMSKQTPDDEGKLYGLGLSLSQDSLGFFDQGWFRHDGDHGQAAARIAGSPGRQEGLVILINGGHDGAGTLRSEIYDAFKAFYGWTN